MFLNVHDISKWIVNQSCLLHHQYHLNFKAACSVIKDIPDVIENSLLCEYKIRKDNVFYTR